MFFMESVFFFFSPPLIKSTAASSVVPDYVIFPPCRASNSLWPHDVWAPAEVGPQETGSEVLLAPRGLAHREQWTRWALLSYKGSIVMHFYFQWQLWGRCKLVFSHNWKKKKILFYASMYVQMPFHLVDTRPCCPLRGKKCGRVLSFTHEHCFHFNPDVSDWFSAVWVFRRGSDG